VKTIPKVLVRLLAVIALAAPAIVIGGSSAQAATRVFPADGGVCVGTQVLRCLELRYDDVNERYRVRAEITDAAGGADASVDVSMVGLANVTIIGTPGWNSDWERMESHFEHCTQGTLVGVDFRAEFWWRNNANATYGNEVRRGSATFTCT